MKFNERYKVYLDITAQPDWLWNDDSSASWVQIFPDIEPFSWELESDELFHRHKWGNVTFRDDPYLSSFIHKTISNLDITQEIRIKIVTYDGSTENDTIRGYFGANDCDYDEDNQVLNVVPAILDQYTAIFENYENKVLVFGGDTSTYKTRWELTSQVLHITENHNVPLTLIANNFSEARSQSQDDAPVRTGAIISNTKSKYKLQIDGSIYIALNILSIQNIKFYIREYILNLMIQEIELIEFLNTSGTEKATIKISEIINVSKGSNIAIECDISDPADFDFVSYLDASITVVAAEIKETGNNIDINLTSSDLSELEVWTIVEHGRASPKEGEWDGSQTLEDYFNDSDGSPDEDGHFNDGQLGMDACNRTIKGNGMDLFNQVVEGIKLKGLSEALGEYEYELSDVTIYEGTTYRMWKPFGTKKRRVYATCTYTREEQLIANGQDTPDESLGWKKSDYSTAEGDLWIRKPFNGVIDTWKLSPVDESGGNTAAFEWNKKITSKKIYPPMEAAKQSFSNAIGLKEIIKKIYNGTSDLISTNDIYSTFFWNDLESSIPWLKTNQNYVTYDIPNELNNIDCVHVKDFDVTDTDILSEDRILELSFKEIISDLRTILPIYWYVDENSDLHIEHIKYLDETYSGTPNLVTDNPLMDETLKFSYDKEKMFATITHSMSNSGYPDFTNCEREFNKIASNKRNKDFKLELKTDKLTTDVRFCVESASNLSYECLCLIAYDENNAMINSYAPVSNQKVSNGNLALSNLLERYWRYEGVWLTGKINGVDKTFLNSSRTKLGKSFSLKGTYNFDSSGDEINFMTTYLGVGLVKSMKIDYDKGISSDIILVYRFSTNTQGDNLKSGSISDKFELITSDGVLFNFGNY